MTVLGLQRDGAWRGWAAVGWALVALIPLAFLAVFFAWPVASLVGRGFVTEAGFSLDGFRTVFDSTRTWRIIGQTLSLAVAGTLGSVLLGLPGAYLLYRTSFPGRAVLRAAVTIPFVLPTVVVGVAFRSLLAPHGPLGFLGLDESFAAIVAAMIFFNYSVIVRTVGTLWARLDPRTTEAARSLGATARRAFWTVTLPALGPAIASGAALVFLFCASSFGIVMMLGGVSWGTVETEIWYQTTQLLDLPAAAALSVVQLAVVTISLSLAGQARARQERALRLRTDTATEQPLRLRRDWPAIAVTVAVTIGVIALPLGVMVTRAFTSAGAFSTRNFDLLATTGGGSLTVPVWQAVANSLVTAAQATAVAVTLGVMVSFVVSRRPRSPAARRFLSVLDSAFMLPLGVSSVTVGFGFLITLNRPPLDLRSSMILIPIAQAIVALPMVVRTLLPVLRAIDPRLHEAAAMLGAGPWRVLATIDVPFALRGIGLAVGFAFATSLGEFGATSFLARPDRPTLPVVIFRLVGRPGADNFGMAMAACVVLATVTAVVMAVAEAIGPKEVNPW